MSNNRKRRFAAIFAAFIRVQAIARGVVKYWWPVAVVVVTSRWYWLKLMWAGYVAFGVVVFGVVGLAVVVVSSLVGFTAGVAVAVYQDARESDREAGNRVRRLRSKDSGEEVEYEHGHPG